MGIADGGQVYKVNTISEVVQEVTGEFDSQARFTNASWACKGEQAHLGAAQQSREPGEFLLAS
jgi:hypothetical protein